MFAIKRSVLLELWMTTNSDRFIGSPVSNDHKPKMHWSKCHVDRKNWFVSLNLSKGYDSQRVSKGCAVRMVKLENFELSGELFWPSKVSCSIRIKWISLFGARCPKLISFDVEYCELCPSLVCQHNTTQHRTDTMMIISVHSIYHMCLWPLSQCLSICVDTKATTTTTTTKLNAHLVKALIHKRRTKHIHSVVYCVWQNWYREESSMNMPIYADKWNAK